MQCVYPRCFRAFDLILLSISRSLNVNREASMYSVRRFPVVYDQHVCVVRKLRSENQTVPSEAENASHRITKPRTSSESASLTLDIHFSPRENGSLVDSVLSDCSESPLRLEAHPDYADNYLDH